ncbi:TrkA family potassium uptake protein [Pontixanthobacter aestiaquae]|uniref:TrkA family potassium uptake protein n=1 Tax=Pontixanthobacter aestiaquae TaxID=1509367 RepID=A0A844Z911_9SPHN|nr:TrkA family potassium uptake protein [Pontixanthobacter aestiaquae]MDN3645539.1 TrkA family potassium uptake protein [Pontixanthobacter aestiaquae]MXO83463.1 TrkA family potassium uptake protein [Pontixanthobacter aestiaquae]
MSAEVRKPVLVIGLGRFGGATARTLERMGHEVLGADLDSRLVQDFAGDLTKVVEADCTDLACLQHLGIAEFEAAVVAIGGDIEASVLAVLALCDLGVTNIWAKATNDNHARILERVGATHVVFPEQRMGERVARLLNERLLDFISFGDEFAIARLKAPEPIIGLPLISSECRKKHGITVVGVKRDGEDFIHAVPDTLIMPEDELVVSGLIEQIEKFAALQ